VKHLFFSAESKETRRSPIEQQVDLASKKVAYDIFVINAT
jgi:hypothetical protein